MPVCREACGYELRVWPLVDITSHTGDFRARFLGPLVERRIDAESRETTVRPLFHVKRSAEGQRSEGFVLYPFLTWRSAPEELSIRFFGIGSYVSRARPPEERPYDRELTVFPFLFYRHHPERGTSFSLLPLYANVENFIGYERIRMLAFPLYLRLEETLWNRTWLPFPFFSWVGGKSGEGVRLWPIYGHTVLGRQYESSYVGWPFNIRAVEHPGQPSAVTTRIRWPFFSTMEGPTIESRSYGFLLILPLYTRTIDRAAGTDVRGFPWPVWSTQDDLKTGERLSTRYTPIYQDRKTATQHSVFYFWPFYRRQEGLGDDSSYRRVDSLFVFYRDQSEGDGAARKRLSAIVPFWVSRESGDSMNAQSLALLDGMFPLNEPLQKLYAPLYRFYGIESGDPAGERNILWRMWTFGPGKTRPPWYFSRE